MSDPLRTQPNAEREAQGPVDPAAQIERLLLAGLDLYFAGQYQEAINIWTRVVFLERGHGRARAYIERARMAIAEQHRESDELFHQGRAAYEHGRLEDARVLLTKAVERGAPSDDALSLLQQLNRFAPVAAGQHDHATAIGPAGGTRTISEPARFSRATFALAGVAVISGLALLAAPLVSWFGNGPTVEPRPAATTTLEPLPVVRTGEVALERARTFYAGGHLADALRTLDRIDVGDPARADAEKLKGDIQRDLLATVRVSGSGVRDGATNR